MLEKIKAEQIDPKQFADPSSLPYFSVIEKALADVKIAEQLVTDAKIALVETIAGVADTVHDDETRQKYIAYLYWCVYDLKPSQIASAFSIEPRNVSNIAGAIALPSQNCQYCGKPVKVTSRSAWIPNEHDECQRKHWREEHAAREAARNNTSVETERRKLELAEMPYYEYLETPEWQERRKRMLKKANYRCQVCNGQGLLNVHHRTYDRRGNELDSDLVVLCRTCHEKFHDIN